MAIWWVSLINKPWLLVWNAKYFMPFFSTQLNRLWILTSDVWLHIKNKEWARAITSVSTYLFASWLDKVMSAVRTEWLWLDKEDREWYHLLADPTQIFVWKSKEQITIIEESLFWDKHKSMSDWEKLIALLWQIVGWDIPVVSQVNSIRQYNAQAIPVVWFMLNNYDAISKALWEDNPKALDKFQAVVKTISSIPSNTLNGLYKSWAIDSNKNMEWLNLPTELNLDFDLDSNFEPNLDFLDSSLEPDLDFLGDNFNPNLDFLNSNDF